jgi:replicative DNA helicase
MVDANAQDIVYSPLQVGNLVISTIEERKANPGAGIRSGIPSLDRTLLPLRPGDLCTITGRPSNYKSGLMSFWARKVAKELNTQEGADNKVVIYVTWEMAIEEIGMYDLSSSAKLSAAALSQGRCTDVELESLKMAAFKRAMSPLWLIGHSIERRKKRPRLTLTNVAKALRWLDDEMKMQPAIVFLDYLQQMEPERVDQKGEVTRRMDIFENVHRCKDMALSLGCPVVLGVQAARVVDERDWKLPQMGDQMESSNIEHTADKMLSVWYPKTSEQLDQPLPRERNLKVTENLLIVGMTKQRLGPAGGWMALYVNPLLNEISDLQK